MHPQQAQVLPERGSRSDSSSDCGINLDEAPLPNQKKVAAAILETSDNQIIIPEPIINAPNIEEPNPVLKDRLLFRPEFRRCISEIENNRLKYSQFDNKYSRTIGLAEYASFLNLAEQAKIDFEKKSARPRNTSMHLDSSNNEALLRSVFEHYNGLCIGENFHASLFPKRYLIDNMDTFRNLGVKKLFMEFFVYDSYIQTELDLYFASENDELSPYLKDYLWFMGCSITYAALVREAKKAGIRIVGIDTCISEQCGYSSYLGIVDDYARFAGMNYAAKEIIEQESQEEEKYVVFCGSAHGARTSCEKTGRKYPGVADFLNIPFFVLESSQTNQFSAQLHVINYKERVEIVDAVLKIPKPLIVHNASESPTDLT